MAVFSAVFSLTVLLWIVEITYYIIFSVYVHGNNDSFIHSFPDIDKTLTENTRTNTRELLQRL